MAGMSTSAGEEKAVKHIASDVQLVAYVHSISVDPAHGPRPAAGRLAGRRFPGMVQSKRIDSVLGPAMPVCFSPGM